MADNNSALVATTEFHRWLSQAVPGTFPYALLQFDIFYVWESPNLKRLIYYSYVTLKYEEKIMGNKSINNKEVRKKKKSDASTPAPTTSFRTVSAQPELIKKKKKPI